MRGTTQNHGEPELKGNVGTKRAAHRLGVAGELPEAAGGVDDGVARLAGVRQQEAEAGLRDGLQQPAVGGRHALREGEGTCVYVAGCDWVPSLTHTSLRSNQCFRCIGFGSQAENTMLAPVLLPWDEGNCLPDTLGTAGKDRPVPGGGGVRPQTFPRGCGSGRPAGRGRPAAASPSAAGPSAARGAPRWPPPGLATPAPPPGPCGDTAARTHGWVGEHPDPAGRIHPTLQKSD